MSLVVLAGCGGGRDLADLEAFMQEAQALPEAHIEPLPPLDLSAPYAYRAGDQRSPFEPSAPIRDLAPRRGDAPAAPNLNRPKQRLESHPIDHLSMVGTLSRGTMRYALVRNQEGAVHRVGVGDYLGQDHGRIWNIDTGAIDLIEIVPNGTGGWMERGRTLPLLVPAP